jgi:hypothetical protein
VGLDRMVTQQSGKAWWKMQVFTIRTGVVTRVGTWCDEDRDVKAWQDDDEDREAGNQR